MQSIQTEEIKILKILLITLILILFSIKTQSQVVHQIYRDDTCFREMKSDVTFEKFYYFNLKDSLPDGIWIVYDVDRRDSLVKHKKIISSVLYENHKKEGLLEMYSYSPYKKKEKVLYYVCNYKNGLKHGAEEQYLIIEDTIFKYLRYHGEYFKGKKDGCFIRIEKDGYLEEQSQYKEDVMKYYAAFAGKKATRHKEIEVISESTFNYTLYLFNDSIFKIIYHISNGILKNIDLIDNDMKIVKNRQCNLKVAPFYHQYQVPMKITYLDKKVLMDDTLYMDYLEKINKKLKN